MFWVEPNTLDGLEISSLRGEPAVDWAVKSLAFHASTHRRAAERPD